MIKDNVKTRDFLNFDCCQKLHLDYGQVLSCAVYVVFCFKQIPFSPFLSHLRRMLICYAH